MEWCVLTGNFLFFMFLADFLLAFGDPTARPSLTAGISLVEEALGPDLVPKTV
jgi:hypothetical protein